MKVQVQVNQFTVKQVSVVEDQFSHQFIMQVEESWKNEEFSEMHVAGTHWHNDYESACREASQYVKDLLDSSFTYLLF